jgi:hypothetical protein
MTDLDKQSITSLQSVGDFKNTGDTFSKFDHNFFGLFFPLYVRLDCFYLFIYLFLFRLSIPMYAGKFFCGW